MAIQHSSIVDAERHNPKGFSTASNNTKLVKNSSGILEWAADGAPPSGSSVYGEIITADGAGSSQFGQKVWKDLKGVFIEDSSGATRPTKAAFYTLIDAFAFSVGDSAEYYFHIPHDYAVGTDLYIHTHWGHNGTAISGNLIWNLSATMSGRAGTIPYTPFSAPIATTINSNTISGTMNITNYPRYCHVVEEIQLSSSTPSASQLNTANVMVDGLIMVHVAPSVIPTITGGTPNEPYLFQVDIHYQADIEGTKNKDPNFYV
jgi:hypothetical protein